MAKSIFITGAPGVGKSTICKELARRGYPAYDIESSIYDLYRGVDKITGKELKNWDNADLEQVKRLKWLCDVDKLHAFIKQSSDTLIFYGGSGSNVLEMIPLFDKVIVLQASKENIKKRLTSRPGNDWGQTAEVQEWIFSHWDNRRATDQEWAKNGAVLINADGEMDDVIEKILGVSK